MAGKGWQEEIIYPGKDDPRLIEKISAGHIALERSFEFGT
jgi:hypothetical protein